MPFPRFRKRGPMPSHSATGLAGPRRPTPRVDLPRVFDPPRRTAHLLQHEGFLAEQMIVAFEALLTMLNLDEVRESYDEHDWISILDTLDWLEWEARVTRAITPQIKSVIEGEGRSSLRDVERRLAVDLAATGTGGGGASKPPTIGPSSGYPETPGPRSSFYATGRFDMTNPYAVRQAERFAADLVVQISRSTKRAIREAVVSSFREGVTYDVLARRLRNSIGLTSAQARAVERYHEQLLNGGMDADRADVLARRYWRKTRNRRAQTIARTEIMQASNFGRMQSWLGAADAGMLDRNLSMKEWVTAPKGPSIHSGTPEVCPSCGPLDGVKVMGLETPFRLASGREVQMPPAHPNCRCTAIVWPPEPPEDWDPEYPHASV